MNTIEKRRTEEMIKDLFTSAEADNKAPSRITIKPPTGLVNQLKTIVKNIQEKGFYLDTEWNGSHHSPVIRDKIEDIPEDDMKAVHARTADLVKARKAVVELLWTDDYESIGEALHKARKQITAVTSS